MSSLRVLEPGLLTTVQDLGRPGHAALGVSASGAADPLSARMGNLLVGNAENAGVLEMTLVGGIFAFDAPALVAVTGSDFGAAVEGRRPGALPPWSATQVEAGDVVRVGPTRSGARAYLCIRGGVVVPPVLGSASTHLLTGLGGLCGRALRKGDVLEIGPDPGGPRSRLRVAALEVEKILLRRTLRVTRGPQADFFTALALERFARSEYEVTEEADRMGLRLSGPPLMRSDARQMLTEGVCVGAVQVPENGQPIVLFVEQQTTGGYPKVANVVSADLPALGQLRPRDRVRFENVSLTEARALLQERLELLDRAVEPA